MRLREKGKEGRHWQKASAEKFFAKRYLSLPAYEGKMPFL
jgi:hypothetical protein